MKKIKTLLSMFTSEFYAILILIAVVGILLLFFFISIQKTLESNYEKTNDVEYTDPDSYKSLCVPITGQPCPF
jgi:hypothetical protein